MAQPSGRKELLWLQDLSENRNWLHLGEDVSVLRTQSGEGKGAGG